MIKKSLFIIILFLISYTSQAQREKIQIGAFIGGSYYYGDIVNTVQFNTIRPSLGISYHKRLGFRNYIKASFVYVRIGAADSSSYNSTWQRYRNLSFYTDIFEMSAIYEHNLTTKAKVMPYIFGGVGFFYFEPKAIHPITNNVVNLRKLKIDGDYLPLAFALPLGVGTRYEINDEWEVCAELGVRFTSTSNLDNIRGDSKYPDLNDLESEDAKVMAFRNKNSLDAQTQKAAIEIKGKPRGKINYITDTYFVFGVNMYYRIR